MQFNSRTIETRRRTDGSKHGSLQAPSHQSREISMANEPIDAKSANADVAAVRGENTAQGGSGVVGISPRWFHLPPPFDVGSGAAVLGSAGFNGIGVLWRSYWPRCWSLRWHLPKTAAPEVGVGVLGQGDSGTGVQGTGGIAGVSGSSTLGSGVLGVSDMGQGVLGKSRTNPTPVQGARSVAGRGVVGISSFVGRLPARARVVALMEV